MASIATQVHAERPNGRRFWKRVAIDTFKVFTEPDTSLRCAGTAFFGFLSLFPAIATVVLIFGLVADRELLVETVKRIDFILPQAAMQLVSEQLLSVVAQPPATLGIGLLISIPLALWSGSRGIDALLYAMSRVRGEPPKRGLVKTVLVAVGLTIAGAIFLVIALVTIAGLPALTSLLPFPTLTELMVLAVRWPVLLTLSVLVLAALYRWGPDRHPRQWRYIWPGALFASLFWVLAGIIFSVYVENFGNYEASFGSMTAGVVLLLWMYNSAQIFVLGTAFNTQLERGDRVKAPAKPRRKTLRAA